ncbi:LysE family translocator [Variovorax paradoxus]|uniref:LysE family translocator n=1 Tax=Variovorax paradoxus TaxID=34073 RepID=UPI003D657665
MNLSLSMAAFALAASISPGPVNVVALGAGARHGFARSIWFVTGATVGFTALLLLTGLGLHSITAAWPAFMDVLHWGGIAFLIYMAVMLAIDDGTLSSSGQAKPPSLLLGAGMQWINPKAWLAAAAGMGVFAGGGELGAVWHFGLIYFAVCYVSIAAWSAAGALLKTALTFPARVRLLNRALALSLVASAAYMAFGS